MLAKTFHTSWAEEIGRTYVEQYVKDERYITDDDYINIIRLQIEANEHALKTCNRICFFDTDIIVTYYYYTLYAMEKNKIIPEEIQKLFDSQFNLHYKDLYDYYVFCTTNGISWVNDGIRRHFNDREKLEQRLRYIYSQNRYDNIKYFSKRYKKWDDTDNFDDPGFKYLRGNYNTRWKEMYAFANDILMKG